MSQSGQKREASIQVQKLKMIMKKDTTSTKSISNNR